MEQRTLGTTGINVSVLALGCWPMGGGYWGAPDDEESIRTIHRALEVGVNFFDTAPAYGGGHSEQVLGKGLAGRRRRGRPFHQGRRCARADPALAGSLVAAPGHGLCGRLLCPLAPQKRAALRNDGGPGRAAPEGRIRAIGVSNFTVEMIEMASRHGTVDVLQPPYNLIWRFIEEDTLPYCQERDIGIVTYSSLAQGLLTGTLRLNTAYRGDDQRPRSVLWQPENYGKCLYAVERLRPVAMELGVSLAQLALRWLVSQGGRDLGPDWRAHAGRDRRGRRRGGLGAARGSDGAHPGNIGRDIHLDALLL